MSVATDVRVHPYLVDLPVFNDEVQAIAESIREVGLLHPPVLDTAGRLIGGRHRLAACELVGVEPGFTTYDGDPLAFILHDNATRKHQSTGQRAAEVALALDSAGRRGEGRWARGSVGLATSESGSSDLLKRIAEAGLVLDQLGRDALVAVAEGDRVISDAYSDAEQARDAQRNRLDREERERQEEAEAKAFVKENAPDLADQVGGPFETYAEALAVWEKRNREEAERIAKEKAAKEKAEREHKAAMTDLYSGMARGLQVCSGYGGYDDIDELMAEFSPAYLNPPQYEREFTTDSLRRARRFADMLINWQESRRG